MSRRSYLAFACFCLLASQAHAQQDTAAGPGPRSPQESLKCIQPRPGFKVELMACEPLVRDPIAFAWGADGKLWVVEMGDYPLGADGKGKSGGRVKFLEKTQRDDGPYDKATLFLDGLPFPTGVTPWGKGVLITAAPDILYAEDTDGDGKADKKEVLYTGFHPGNQQHRVNGLVWGFDGWFYGANGDSGGKVKSLKTGAIVDIRGRDFRIKPATGEIEAQTGQSQFGRHRSDWGDWFGNNNTNPMFHYVLDDHYLRRNPFVFYPDPRVNVSVKPGASQVFPISKPQPRFNTPNALNHFTSACSAIVYRDTLFGPDFALNSFVSEPVHNLIHREVMKPRGVTFTSQRAADEQTSEFLASSDNWFRPTMIQTGPDGALWVADMYRLVIEHPEWIPKDWQKKLDLRAGHDKGRLYRVYPEKATPRSIPNLAIMSTKELVEQLASPNGWVRDTAQQVLESRFTRLDDEKLVALVRTQLANQENPLAVLHAMYTLDNRNSLPLVDVHDLMRHKHPGIRRHALRILDTWDTLVPDLTGLIPCTQDPDPQVRLQACYTLGRSRSRTHSELLGKLMVQHSEDRFLSSAALSSLNADNLLHVARGIDEPEKLSLTQRAMIFRLAKQYGFPEAALELASNQIRRSGKEATIQQMAVFADLLDSLGNIKLDVNELRKKDAGESSRKNLEEAALVMKRLAFRTLEDANSSDADKLIAMRVLKRGLASKEADFDIVVKMLSRQVTDDVLLSAVKLLGDSPPHHKLLAAQLNPRTPDQVQRAVIESLGKSDKLDTQLLLKPWKGYTPALRSQVAGVLLSHRLWSRYLLDAVERKEVLPAELEAAQRQVLLSHPDDGLRKAAKKLLASATDADRELAVQRYWLAYPDKADAGRGAKLFAAKCAACHRLGDVGSHVGPDLASLADRSPQTLLTAILDPNRAVESRYLNYLAVTKEGLTLTGMLASETSTTLTLVSSDGKKHELLRNQLDELVSTGKSLMPDGLEKDLTVQDVADVIAHVRAAVAAPKK